jgi:hypothetical protein
MPPFKKVEEETPGSYPGPWTHLCKGLIQGARQQGFRVDVDTGKPADYPGYKVCKGNRDYTVHGAKRDTSLTVTDVY